MIEVDEEIIKSTCDLHPEVLKRTICMEECAELIQAISKVTRDKLFTGLTELDPDDAKKHLENETEEIADVILCIKMLQYYDNISEEDIQEWIWAKQLRQKNRDTITIRNRKETNDKK